MRHVFSANSNLKPCTKSRINISRNPSRSFNLPDLQETVSNLRECIFHDIDILANIAKKDTRGKKTDIRYNVKKYFLNICLLLHFYSCDCNCKNVMHLGYEGGRAQNISAPSPLKIERAKCIMT